MLKSIKVLDFMKNKPLFIFEKMNGEKGATFDFSSILLNKEKIKEYNLNKRIL